MGILGSHPKRAIDELVRGKGFAKRLKIMMSESGSSGDDDVSSPSPSPSPSPALEAEDLLKAVLTCFENTLCMLLNNTSTTHDDVASSSPKEDFSSNLPADTDARNSPEFSGDSSCRTTSTTLITKDRRGCYKRRKTCESWTQDSSIPVEDGHAWRKYGQKAILHAKYPRSYFRCTHKHDQGCKANKQVQRIDEEEEDDNPNLLYRTTYYGHHTCTNDSNELVDQYDDDHHGRKDSSSVIDFRRQPNHDKNKNNCSSFFTSFQPVKHEYSSYNSMNKLNQDIDIPINHHHHHLSTYNYKYSNQISYSSSSDLLASPFDQATDHVSGTPTTLDMGGYDDDDDALYVDF